MTPDFDDWYQGNRDGLVASLGRAIADLDRAADAVDEAFVRALERWDLVATYESPAGWLYTVARNAARRTYRRDALAEERHALWAPSAGDESDGGAFDSLIESLPPRQSTAVRLRHELGLTEEEIAARMGVTRSTVSSTLRSAHRAIAQQLRNARPNGDTTMDLQLARVRAGHDDGCDLAYLEAEVTERVRYSDAVRDQVRIRRDDLVAVDVAAEPPEIVWRWWHGTIESIEGDVAWTRRPAASDAGWTTKQVALPEALRPAARESTSIWFGRGEDDELVAIAVAGRPEAARAELPRVLAAYADEV